MIELQFDLFEEQPSESDILRLELSELKLQLEKYRKSMFARIGASGKEIIEMIEKNHQMEHRLANLERMLRS
jgi:hypothetical protein